MNMPAVASGACKLQRWLILTLLTCLVQLVFVLGLSSRLRLPAPVPRPPLQVRWSGAFDSSVRAAPPGSLLDPTTFALVTQDGFSSAAWLTMPHFGSPLASQLPPPESLELVGDYLGADFAEYVKTNLVSDELVLEVLPPSVARIRVATPAFGLGTVLRLEDLGDRALVSGRPVPEQTEPLLTNTVVRVLINPDGTTVSVALLTSSGVPKADQDALAFATSARFTPQPGRPAGADSVPNAPMDLAIGRMVFQWTRAQLIEVVQPGER